MVSTSLILANDSIWHTPHVVQYARRGEMRWDELLGVLVQDLAFGMSQDKWVFQLLREGDIGLARELARRLDIESVIGQEIVAHECEWQQMAEIAKAEVARYISEQGDELKESDVEAYKELLGAAHEYLGEAAYGDAVSTLELALKSAKGVVERRRETAAAAFAATEARVSKARSTFAAIKAPKFPGGPTEHARAWELLLRADDQLYRKDYVTAMQVAGWVEALCEGRDINREAIDEVLAVPFIVKQVTEEEPPSRVEELPVVLEEDLIFEREWTREDDDHLIDNYDVLSDGQLNLRFHTTEDEIERRIQYLGLMHDRETGKRVRWRNPYVAGKPLRDRRVFVGREDVFTFIEDSLGSHQEGEDRNMIVLLGHRRTGKTSILLQLRKNRREILEPRVPIFVDMEGLLPFRGGVRNFFWKLSCCIQREIEDLEKITLPMPIEEEFADPLQSFVQFLRRAEQGVGERGLVLMLDEFHAIEPRRAQLDRDVYKMLRSVIQHSTQVDFILSGTMEMEKLMRNYQAVMFGSAISKKIDFLDEKDAKELIVMPVQSYVAYSQEAVDMIVELTASHPYFVQLVCWTLMQHLINRGKSKVSVHDVERILPLALERGAHFDEIWVTETSDLECYVMAVVGELATARGNWCSVAEIEKRLRGEHQMPDNHDELDEAVSNLTNRRILRRSNDGNSVRFQVDVFGQWVYANKPFEVVRRDIRAEAATLRQRLARQPKGDDRTYDYERRAG